VALLLGFVDGHRDLDSPDGVPAKLRTEGHVPEFRLDRCASMHGLWGRIMCRYSKAAVCRPATLHTLLQVLALEDVAVDDVDRVQAAGYLVQRALQTWDVTARDGAMMAQLAAATTGPGIRIHIQTTTAAVMKTPVRIRQQRYDDINTKAGDVAARPGIGAPGMAPYDTYVEEGDELVCVEGRAHHDNAGPDLPLSVCTVRRKAERGGCQGGVHHSIIVIPLARTEAAAHRARRETAMQNAWCNFAWCRGPVPRHSHFVHVKHP
jgi:hypothetical protein